MELSTIMNEVGRMSDWAGKIAYNVDLNEEDKKISEAVDKWAKEIGNNGHDRDHELSAMIQKTVSPEVVTAHSELLSRMFDQDSIGEFDDHRVEAYENTLVAHDAIPGGNVDRSYLNHKVLAPTYFNLQVETEVSLADLRRGGYKTVANLINNAKEALELAKFQRVFTTLDAAILSGAPGYVTEATAAPTATSVDALNEFLIEVAENETPLIVGSNSNIHKISKLPGVSTYLTDKEKNQFNEKGVVSFYGGSELQGVNGTKKYNNQLLMPAKRIFGVAGKVGYLTTRGTTRALQETDINAEKIHLKVSGYDIGITWTDLSKVGKIVLQ